MNAINNAGKYESNFTDIYPEELELCRQNDSNAEATFLDLDIKIKNNKFQIGIFDKRDSVPLSIVRMPKKSSNISKYIFVTKIKL